MKCTKVRYKSHKQAVSAIHLISSKGVKRRNTPVRDYFCDECGFYHITKHPIEGYLENKSEPVDLLYKEQWKRLQQ